MGERFPWALSSTINTPLGSLSRKPLLSESLSNLNRASLQSSLGSPTEYFGVGPQTERDLSGHLHSKSASLLEVPPRHQSDAMKQNSDLNLRHVQVRQRCLLGLLGRRSGCDATPLE